MRRLRGWLAMGWCQIWYSTWWITIAWRLQMGRPFSSYGLLCLMGCPSSELSSPIHSWDGIWWSLWDHSAAFLWVISRYHIHRVSSLLALLPSFWGGIGVLSLDLLICSVHAGDDSSLVNCHDTTTTTSTLWPIHRNVQLSYSGPNGYLILLFRPYIHWSWLH
jgi:hypothetical protein